MTFLRKYDMCMLCDSSVIYQCTYVLLVTVLFDTNIYSITVICSISLYFNSELSSTIM